MRQRSRAIAAGFCLLAAMGGPAARAGGSGPPQALVKLEREVGLRVAHVRDAGPVEPAKRKMLSEAQQYDATGEEALRAGDYKSAEDSFLRARRLLEQIGP